MPDLSSLYARFASQRADIERQYQSTLARLAQAEKGSYTEYGFRPMGQGKFELDPNLQYGRGWSMLRSQGAALDAEREQALSRGLRGPGLSANKEKLLRFMLGEQTAALGANFSKVLSDISGQRQDALFTRDRGLSDLDMLLDMLSQVSTSGGDSGTEPPPPEEEPTDPTTSGAKWRPTHDPARLWERYRNFIIYPERTRNPYQFIPTERRQQGSAWSWYPYK